MTVRQRVQALADESNADFLSRLLPGIERETVLGVRMPALRALAKELKGTDEAAAFLAALPHRYLDENNLHALLINDLAGYEDALAALDAFLPYVDNWATCDALRPKAARKNLADFRRRIDGYLASPAPYTVRFGLEMLMCHYLDAAFSAEQNEQAAALRSEQYYIRMMQSWYFATALAKQWDATIPYLEQRRLEPWTHAKTIQKAIESYRISDERKAYLRTLKTPSGRCGAASPEGEAAPVAARER